MRKVPNTRYYNEEVHKAAFVLPEFGRALVEEEKNILPVLGQTLAEGAPRKKILLLGSGFVAKPAAEYVLRNPANSLTVGTYQPRPL